MKANSNSLFLSSSRYAASATTRLVLGRRLMKFLGAAGLAGALGLGAQADVFHVTTAQELQTALSTAAANGVDDTILLAAGTYKGRFAFLTTQARALTIKAEDGLATGQVVLDAQQGGRVLQLDAGSTNVDFTVQTLVIRGGAAASSQNGGGLYARTVGNVSVSACGITGNTSGSGGRGGGLYVENAASAALNDSIISGNISVRGSYSGNNLSLGGGACFNSVNTVTLSRNLVASNTASGGEGGGLAFQDGGGTLTLTDNQVVGNASIPVYSAGGYAGGGGIKIIRNSTTGTVILRGNLVKRNTAYGLGAGVSVQTAFSVELTDNVIKDNTFVSGPGSNGTIYDGYGGGVCISGSLLNLSRNTFSGNKTGLQPTYGGGALYLSVSLGTNLCSDNFFDGNSSVSKGGGVYASLSGAGTTLRFLNNTLRANSATNGGGVAFAIAGSTEILHVYNNIIWGNTASGSGGDVYLTGYGAERKFYNNNVHDIDGVFDYAGNNLDVAPLFMDQSRGDYRLRANSLCINAGTNGAPSLPATDMDGNPRIGDGVVDMGAYEQSATDFHPADVNTNWVIEANEFTAYATAWTNNVSWSNGPSRIPIDYVTRAGYLLEKGGTYHNAGGGKPRNWQPGL